MTEIREFRIDIPQADLDDLADRLARTRWADELPGAGERLRRAAGVRAERWSSGWRDGYDWRAWEASSTPTRSSRRRSTGRTSTSCTSARPSRTRRRCILTHGWPASCVEYLDVIGPLSDPRAHGGDPADAFHLVIPSIPGFALLRPDHRAGLEPVPDRAGVGRADAPPRLRAVRRARQRRRLAHLAGGGPPRPASTWSACTSPSSSRSPPATRPSSRACPRRTCRTAAVPAVVQRERRATTSCSRPRRRPSRTRWPTRRSGQLAGARSCSALDPTTTTSSPTRRSTG